MQSSTQKCKTFKLQLKHITICEIEEGKLKQKMEWWQGRQLSWIFIYKHLQLQIPSLSSPKGLNLVLITTRSLFSLPKSTAAALIIQPNSKTTSKFKWMLDNYKCNFQLSGLYGSPNHKIPTPIVQSCKWSLNYNTSILKLLLVIIITYYITIC